jgi:hypothetical protein
MNTVQNPVSNFSVTKTPAWLCKHDGAVVIDYEKKRYKCQICAPDKVIRKLSQDEILSTLTSADGSKGINNKCVQ